MYWSIYYKDGHVPSSRGGISVLGGVQELTGHSLEQLDVISIALSRELNSKLLEVPSNLNYAMIFYEHLHLL